MRKIPTLFLRTDDMRHITREVNPACQWVLDGEGVATRKWDGTCCKVEGGKLFARREVKPGQTVPDDFAHEETDCATGKAFGWVPVGDGPEWAHHAEAWARFATTDNGDGTYELIGPKINGNRDHWPHHALVRHGMCVPMLPVDRTYDGLRDLLTGVCRLDWEGLVFHHPDGRMAKIKAKDFPRVELGES